MLKKELSLEEQMQEIYETFDRVFSEVLKEVEKRNIPELREKLIQRGYSLLHNDPRTTFKKNEIYFMDFNPLSLRNIDYSPKKENMDFWNTKPLGYSRFLDEVLKEGCEKGKSPFQLNMQGLVSGITGQPYESALRNIFSTNLFFYRTPNEIELKNYPSELIHCWPFHEQLLKVVQPRIILCNGNDDFSTYSELKRYLKRKYEIENKKVNSDKTIKSFEIEYNNDEDIYVIGVSRLDNPELNLGKIIAGVKEFL